MVIIQVVSRIEKLLSLSVATSSVKVYKRAWVLFKEAMVEMKIPFNGSIDLPISSSMVIMFIGYLSVIGLSSSTITSYTCALGYIHKLMNAPDPTSKFCVQKVLAATNKLNKSHDSRLPITIVILQRLCESLFHTVPKLYLRQLFRTMFIVAFFGLMRLAEITQNKDGIVSIMIDQVKFTSSAIIITISQFKHNVSLRPLDIVLPAQQDLSICPVFQMRKYLNLRGLSAGPLFRYADGHPVSRNYFCKNLTSALRFCGLQTSLYKSHSFRIGGATFYAQLGMTDNQIRIMGRWNSNAFVKYIRNQRVGVFLQCSTTPLAVSWS